MTPTRRKSAQSATQDSVFTARVPYQAEIVNITFYGQDDEDGTFIIEHEINMDGRYIIYEETFNNNIDDPRVKKLLDSLAPYGITGDNLEDAIGFREEITMAEVYKPSRGESYWNIRTRTILGPETE